MSDERREQLRGNAIALTRRGAIGATVLGVGIQVSLLLGPFAGIVGGAGVILALVAHGIALRIGLVGVAEAATGRDVAARVRRWLIRLSYLSLASTGYSLMLTPVFGVLAGPVTVAGITWLVHAYLAWGMEQDASGEGLHPIEGVLVGILALLVLSALAAVLFFGAALGGLVALLTSG